MGTNYFPRELHDHVQEISILMGENLMQPIKGNLKKITLHFSALPSINTIPHQTSLLCTSLTQQSYIMLGGEAVATCHRSAKAKPLPCLYHHVL